MIQLIDLSPRLKAVRQKERNISDIDMKAWEKVLNGVEHIAIIGIKGLKIEDYGKIAYIAKQNNCTMSNFYFAQDEPLDTVKETEGQYMEDLVMNKIEDNSVYIIKSDYEKITEYTKLPWYEIDDYIVIVADEIEL